MPVHPMQNEAPKQDSLDQIAQLVVEVVRQQEGHGPQMLMSTVDFLETKICKEYWRQEEEKLEGQQS